MNVVGLDFGTTQVKMTLLKDKVIFGAKALPRTLFTAEDTESIVNEFLGECEVSAADVDTFALTGVGSKDIGDILLGVRTVKFDEFAALTKGSLMLSGMKQALIVSVGTGSAFVMAESEDKFYHIGGSGVGGTSPSLTSSFSCWLRTFSDRGNTRTA